MRRGFSLIESLMAMTLFLIILVSSFQAYQSARTHFRNLLQSEEANTAAHGSIDRMIWEVNEAGSGLHKAMSQGWLDALYLEKDMLILRFAESELSAKANLSPGQNWIPLEKTSELKKGQEICIHDPFRGEVKTILQVEKTGITLSSPLTNTFRFEETTILKIKRISFYLDRKSSVLRRKVNSSPAQPLCEEVSHLDIQYDKTANLMSISLIMSAEKDTPHEITIYPKNLALSIPPGV
ncbi:prepilin-type N-terminal cleavage/methylation domain-containing protein [Acidobacteriota bacterium]